jgi:hypothetical protein
MKSHYAATSALGALAAALTSLAPTEAEARIDCQNGYQRVAGNLISSPYCQDDLIARVAATYGINTSGTRLRADHGHKREVCRFIGRDVRLYEACVLTAPSVKGRPL